MNIAVLGAGVMGRLTERVAAESGIGVAGVVEPLEGGRLENLGQKNARCYRFFPSRPTPTRFADFARNVESRRS